MLVQVLDAVLFTADHPAVCPSFIAYQPRGNGLSNNTKFSVIWLVNEAITVIASAGIRFSEMNVLKVFKAVAASAEVRVSVMAELRFLLPFQIPKCLKPQQY